VPQESACTSKPAIVTGEWSAVVFDVIGIIFCIASSQADAFYTTHTANFISILSKEIENFSPLYLYGGFLLINDIFHDKNFHSM